MRSWAGSRASSLLPVCPPPLRRRNHRGRSPLLRRRMHRSRPVGADSVRDLPARPAHGESGAGRVREQARSYRYATAVTAAEPSRTESAPTPPDASEPTRRSGLCPRSAGKAGACRGMRSWAGSRASSLLPVCPPPLRRRNHRGRSPLLRRRMHRSRPVGADSARDLPARPAHGESSAGRVREQARSYRYAHRHYGGGTIADGVRSYAGRKAWVFPGEDEFLRAGFRGQGPLLREQHRRPVSIGVPALALVLVLVLVLVLAPGDFQRNTKALRSAPFRRPR
ncbi:hypothetical protein HNP46_001377 [Pseudomonas nitritireducens]|uniref:Uncharacterized protein n=1 Tax=Pseudomonas nitroreducens TaxID=46680 RepID=A0A7W7KI59_PSENT|nr:hypothetical protein [Pseudomonas nitritireducens]